MAQQNQNSPSQLVVRRFIKIRLALTGLVIIVFTAVFSFIMPCFMPYGETQQFTRTVTEQTVFADAAVSDSYTAHTADGSRFTASDMMAFILAESRGESRFGIYEIERIGDKSALLRDADDKAAVILTKYAVTAYETLDFSTLLDTLTALENGETEFTSNGITHTLLPTPYGAELYTNDAENPTADISALVISRQIDHDLRRAVCTAISQNSDKFTHSGTEYTITTNPNGYTVRTQSQTTLLDTYASPSRAHFLGTDGSGMDILTRLMYGGRVSLTVGFAVIFIEALLGTVLGGIAGYFGGWTDALIMRTVDTVNCIPTTPLYLILGSVIGTMKISPAARIYLMMIMLGLTGWTGMARLTRGQILSLRETEFMTAAESLGLPPTRRIFRHLLPNTVPQLIVYATMSLGSVILTEAVLSFLNLGIRYPYASWGSIVNAVNDPHVLTSYPFVWIPAGVLILTTVLAFNLLGDGLRDAFDPRGER